MTERAAMSGSERGQQAPVTTATESEDDTEEVWLRATSVSDAFLAEPAEDIYTVKDGEPFRDAVA